MMGTLVVKRLRLLEKLNKKGRSNQTRSQLGILNTLLKEMRLKHLGAIEISYHGISNVARNSNYDTVGKNIFTNSL